MESGRAAHLRVNVSFSVNITLSNTCVNEIFIPSVITCDTPHVPPASYVVGYDYNVHSTITYHCDPGHILRGEPLLKCLESGDWDNEAPDCKCEIQITEIFFNFLINFNVLSC